MCFVSKKIIIAIPSLAFAMAIISHHIVELSSVLNVETEHNSSRSCIQVRIYFSHRQIIDDLQPLLHSPHLIHDVKAD